MPNDVRVLVPISGLLSGAFPADFVSAVGDALDFVALDPRRASLRWDPSGFALRQRLVILQEVQFDLPLISGASIRLGRPGEQPETDFTLTTAPVAWIEVDNLALTLHLPPDIVKAYRQLPSGEWRTAEENGVSRG